ncbi:hypothetical protein RB195_022729 [Necator americanus]|uniref:Uncharacterized protein n=1 Tax=Necator americanus TaxID=51031 RepID=A0ABR1EGD1_NECAM
MDEDARLKELDYIALKTLQFVTGLQDPSLREVRLRMLSRLVRDYRPGHERWIPARVKNRQRRAMYDVLTEKDDLWRRQANQMRGERQRRVSYEKTKASNVPFNQEDQRYHYIAKTIADAKDNVEDQAPTIVSPTTT